MRLIVRGAGVAVLGAFLLGVVTPRQFAAAADATHEPAAGNSKEEATTATEGSGGRGKGRRAWVSGYGGRQMSEIAVLGALDWLARHQAADGSWSLGDYPKHCSDASCTGPGTHKADAGATALGVLPFLGVGISYRANDGKKDPPDALREKYSMTVFAAVNWLVTHQKANGDLAAGAGQMMYSHGLATIALCEAYALSRDKPIAAAAEKAVKFIEFAQNNRDGGWRYNPGDNGDTSVLGWQMSALKSAQQAGIAVEPEVFQGAKRYLKSCAKEGGGAYGYMPGNPATPCMSAVGLLCSQYLGAKPEDAAMIAGAKLLAGNLPDGARRNIYYWYYGTRAMHNLPGADWERWHGKVRAALVDSQVKDDACAHGSWDPQGDAWGGAGGRLMVTALSALTLEVPDRNKRPQKGDNEAESPKSEPRQ